MAETNSSDSVIQIKAVRYFHNVFLLHGDGRTNVC